VTATGPSVFVFYRKFPTTTRTLNVTHGRHLHRHRLGVVLKKLLSPFNPTLASTTLAERQCPCSRAVRKLSFDVPLAAPLAFRADLPNLRIVVVFLGELRFIASREHMLSNVADHRPGASGVRFGTATSSPGSVHLLVRLSELIPSSLRKSGGPASIVVKIICQTKAWGHAKSQCLEIVLVLVLHKAKQGIRRYNVTVNLPSVEES